MIRSLSCPPRGRQAASLGRGRRPLLCSGERGVNHACEHRAKDGRQPEQPQLLQSPAASDQGGPGAAGGIDGEISHGNADQVDRVSANPIAMGAKPTGARSSVAPRMIIRNIKVSTISAIRQAPSAYPPGECSP